MKFIDEYWWYHTVGKLRSKVFQRWYIIGGVGGHLVQMSENNDFLKKNRFFSSLPMFF